LTEGVNWLTLCNFRGVIEVLLMSEGQLTKLAISWGNCLFTPFGYIFVFYCVQNLISCFKIIEFYWNLWYIVIGETDLAILLGVELEEFSAY